MMNLRNFQPKVGEFRKCHLGDDEKRFDDVSVQ